MQSGFLIEREIISTDCSRVRDLLILHVSPVLGAASSNSMASFLVIVFPLLLLSIVVLSFRDKFQRGLGDGDGVGVEASVFVWRRLGDVLQSVDGVASGHGVTSLAASHDYFQDERKQQQHRSDYDAGSRRHADCDSYFVGLVEFHSVTSRF